MWRWILADVEEAEKSLYDARFLLARPVLAALQQSPAVLMVDEVDRADDEFEAFLLEVLSTFQVTIPELGTVQAATPPTVVLTSSRDESSYRRRLGGSSARGFIPKAELSAQSLATFVHAV